MNFKFCPNCGRRISVNAQYCKYCGRKQNVPGTVIQYPHYNNSHVNFWIVGLLSILLVIIISVGVFFGIVRNPKILPNYNFVRQTSVNNWVVKSHWEKGPNPYHEIVRFSPDNKIYSKISAPTGKSLIWNGSYHFYKNGKVLHIHWDAQHQLASVSDNYHLRKYTNGGYYFRVVNSYNDVGQLKFTKVNNHRLLKD